MKLFGTYIYLEMLVETVIDNEIIGHAYTVRLHRMTNAIIVISDFGYKALGGTLISSTYNHKSRKHDWAENQTCLILSTNSV